MYVSWDHYTFTIKGINPETKDPIIDSRHIGELSGEVVATVAVPYKFSDKAEACFVIAMPDGTFEVVAVTECKRILEQYE